MERRSGGSFSSVSDPSPQLGRTPIAIAATFTAEPIQRALSFWMDTLQIQAEISFAPYAQILQELLNPESLLCSNTRGFNVVLIRLEDWLRERSDESTEEQSVYLRGVARELADAFSVMRRRTSAPTLVFFGPTSSAIPDSAREAIEQIQRDLVARLESIAGFHCWSHAELARLYPVREHEDLRADRVGHIPYTDEYFAAVATLLARRIAALCKPQYKVIAIDCDNTLWKGICGEDGHEGIELTPAHLKFQQLLVRQHDAGMLLCLVSKNNPADVEAVFHSHPDMPLREDHLISSRINWEPKSSNLISLAEELELGLDSFLLIDDSPMEVSEVQAGCPSVLALHFPTAREEIERFMDHVWAFDRVGVTNEAKHRTAQYRENRARSLAREGSASIDEFLASLQLQVDVSRMTPSQLPRVAELVQRTNQFNLRGVRRRANEIDALCNSDELHSLVVRVRDRFGDYGLVGAVLFSRTAGHIEVDTFVLSCRVLGRGVEHRLVNELGNIARVHGCGTVVLKYRETARNAPARNFLEKALGEFETQRQDGAVGGSERIFAIPAEIAETLGHRASADEELVEDEPRLQPSKATAPVAASVRWHESAYRCSSISALLQEINRSSSNDETRRAEYVAPRTAEEATLAEIWRELLGIPDIGVHDEFFDLGGDSVLAVQAISRIGDSLGRELSLDDFFEKRTLAGMAATLADAADFGAPIPRAERAGPAPLSSAQQRLWFVDKLEGGGAAYHNPLCVSAQGPLNRSALQAALDTVMQRHEILRSVVTLVDDQPTQRALPDARLLLQVVDLTGLDPTERAAGAQDYAIEEVARPFDLAIGPLIRAKLIKRSDVEHVLVVTMHDMVSDRWSSGVLLRELGALYCAYLVDAPNPLPPLPLQYADYAAWQRQRLAQADLQDEVEFWKKHLQGAPELITLPTSGPRPAVQEYRGATVPLSLGPSLTDRVKSLARRLDVTLATILYATWSILLSKLSGQDDLVVGMPVANRQRTELEGLLGFFVNTLPMRVRLEDDPCVTDVLQQVTRTMLQAFANQDVPFERIVEVLQPARSLSHSPIFQVMFLLQNTPRADVEWSGLALTEEDVPARAAKFDLQLTLRETQNGITGSINYATALFEKEAIERWANAFKIVLNAILENPNQPVSRLSILSQSEYRQVVESFNATEAAYPHEKLIHELFEEQAARTPAAAAIIHGSESISYAELNARANQLARMLRNAGVGPDERVAVCLERGIELVVALLGVLKAGGAYVPLDPRYPSERQQYMLTSAAPRVVLAQESFEAEWDAMAGLDSGNIDSREIQLAPAHLAYVIYTSGSTGNPKGVMVHHSGVVNFLSSMQRSPGISASDCVLAVTTISFDIAALELFLPLVTGASVVLASREDASDAARLIELIERHAVTILQATPVTWQLLLSAGWSGRPGLKALCGGEALTGKLATQLVPRVAELWNLYGPTETTIWSCARRVISVPRDASAVESIGGPIWNTQVYILDRHGEPVPVAVTGEIHIGGAGVARGYLNRPELTQERFVSDPFRGKGRMYRTGDLGRWRVDGTIEYLGRNDHQVKIRGFRIELGEIETQLSRHAQVKEAAVMAREDVPGEKRLVGYVTVRGEEAPSVESLRAHVKQVLPEYMVPGAIVVLEKLPLTANGKLDRKALPAPEQGSYASRQYEAPQGEVEEIVAGIWQELLRVEQVGRHDNFFELGGHSLLIVQMQERLRRRGLSAEVRRIFESATLKELAGALGDEVQQYEVPPNCIPAGCEKITPQMLPLVELDLEQLQRIAQAVPGGMSNIQDIYPLAPLQEGLLFHHLLEPGEGDIYSVSSVLTVSSRERVEELIAGLQGVVDRHDILRTAVLWEQLPRPVQVVYRQALLEVEQIPLHREEDGLEQLKERTRPERQRLDLRRAPLLRVQIAADPHSPQWYVVLQSHHIVGDYTSQEIVIAEVMAYLGGHAAQLPEPVPYRNHVAQALEYARRHDAEEFFRGKLSEVDEPTAPYGVMEVRAEGGPVREASEALQDGLARRIRQQARRLSVSAAALFHAGWALVVGRTSGRDDVVYGSVLLGRLQGSAGSQRILGMFINTLPLRLNLSGRTARELVEQTQRELVELLGHEQASLAVAQRCSGISGSAGLFSALLNYRHSVADLHSGWSQESGIRMLGGQERTNYPVTMSVDDQGEGFVLTAKTDRRIDAQRMTGYLRTAMDSLVDALERASSQEVTLLAILPAQEREQLIEGFNATEVEYPREKLIHELFEEQVGRTPQALAVLHGRQSLTYAELNRRANQLAHYLRQRGVGPECLVGVYVERSIEMVVAILATLKAGGAYVPLDPAYPDQRIQYLLNDTACPIVLTQENMKDRLPGGRTLIAIDSQWQEISRQSPRNIPRQETWESSSNLAYLIYTSGSTGQPKGVAIEHRNAVNLICWAHSEAPPEVLAQTLLATSLNFDLHVYECFVPLTAGGSLRVVPNALALAREREGVTLINTVPSAIKALLDVAGIPRSAHTVNLAGEALKKEIVDRLFAESRIEWVCNLYGPSETTTYSTGVSMPREKGFNSSIGGPIWNTQVYILDRHGEPVPVAVTGEIHIGGAGVARGYLNRPELTQERFVSDPFRGKGRMYRTGDLGRWRVDGTIEYLGRNDHQVKIRGFRIELGEIETQLSRHAQVKEAAVMAREDVPGEKRLVGYVTVRGEEAPSVESLRAHVKQVLPEYMVPGAIVVLEKLPLTANGKLDRKALPAPEQGSYASRQYEAPQGEVEEIVAGIWQELLRVEQVGRHDNFFELGGHSLLIVQMQERLRRRGLSAEVRRIFESATLKELAGALGDEVQQYEVPPNCIPAGCEKITPQMLPLVELDLEQLQRIAQAVPGGMSNIQDIYPLAPLQEGLLFHHLLEPGEGDIYSVSSVLTVSSRERVEELIAGLQGVVDRHDILRTAVLWEQLPRPVQVVYRQALLEVEQIPLHREEDGLEQLKERTRPERQRLDLRRAPLLRVQIAADPHSPQWYVVLQSHHIVGDYTSQEIVIAEVMAYLGGHAAQLPEPVPYRNHVAQALEYARRHDAEEFFRGKLSEVDEPTAPYGVMEVRAEGGPVREASEALQDGLARRIRQQARRLSVSAAALFHAGWALVVGRTSGRDDVVYGSVLLGRLQGSAGSQRILGMFINTLPLRLNLSGRTARELVEQTQRELVELLGHEQASLAVAQRCSGISGSAGLFSALLNYRHSVADLHSGWSQESGIRMLGGQERTNYPVTMSVDDQGEGFVLTAKTDRRIDAQRMTGYLRTAMDSLVDALERASSQEVTLLAILPAQEREQLIEGFNATEVEYPREKLIHELFEEQVGRTPQALAVLHGRQSLTYAELNRRANQLAHYLRQRGVGPECLVGVYVERSIEMVVAILATLKAGGAYVPLDPAYPAERLEQLLQDAKPRLVLSHAQQETVVLSAGAEVVPLGERWREISQRPDGNPDARQAGLRSHHLAYVIYTSGSTGIPNGVMVEHRNLTSLWQGLEPLYREAGFCQRVGLNASFNFDGSVKQLVQVVSGRTVCIVPSDLRQDASGMRSYFEASQIDGIDCTPSQLRAWVAAGLLEGGAYPRMMLVGGEPIERDLWSRLAQSSTIRFFNVYGPTESTVDATFASVRGDSTSPHIGRPLENRRLYILDRHRQPVPPGVTGEIHIGGAGVARGYLNRPELTQERFLDDPFRGKGRMYRTGDLGRWRVDGTIEYLGRNDHQVKIRGFRIELGEIETQLSRHAQVKEAAVIAREDVPGEKRLVGYVTVRGEGVPSVESLRAHVKQVLPEYMVPGAIVVLEKLPLTANGKLDRKALPAPEQGSYASRQYEAPQGEVEEIVAGIWQELLRVEQVGRHDNFFELGGHSLLGTRMISRISQATHVELPLKSIFETENLAALAGLVAEEQSHRANRGLAREIRNRIEQMEDDAVLAQIAALEKELDFQK